MDTAITVNGRIPNLFRGLLAYRPRADRNSHENFLTEAFAYTLAQDPSFASRIIKKLVGRKFALKRITNIRTQVSLGDENSRGLPDMMIEVLERNGKALQIWIENKWSASANPDQISRYIGYLKAHDSKVRKRLALLTPRHTDAMFCSGAVRGIAISHITWSAIHELLASHRVSGIAKEFEHFLGEKDLVVKPIRLAATLTTAANGGRRDLRENLWTLCTRVQQGLSATVLTKDVTCHDGYGRVALWMFKGRVSLGVLYDTTDHATRFLDEKRPLDIVVRVEGPYKKANSEPARAKLRPVVKKLELAGFDCERHRPRGNHHTLVLGHLREGFPFDLNSDEQVARLTEIVDSTQLLLARDESVMRLLNGVKHY